MPCLGASLQWLSWKHPTITTLMDHDHSHSSSTCMLRMDKSTVTICIMMSSWRLNRHFDIIFGSYGCICHCEVNSAAFSFWFLKNYSEFLSKYFARLPTCSTNLHSRDEMEWNFNNHNYSDQNYHVYQYYHSIVKMCWKSTKSTDTHTEIDGDHFETLLMTSEYINQVLCINMYLVWIVCLCKQEYGFSLFLCVCVT